MSTCSKVSNCERRLNLVVAQLEESSKPRELILEVLGMVQDQLKEVFCEVAELERKQKA